jgi:hypothetical protein
MGEGVDSDDFGNVKIVLLLDLNLFVSIINH